MWYRVYSKKRREKKIVAKKVLKALASILLLTTWLLAFKVTIRSLASPQPRVVVVPEAPEVAVEDFFVVDILLEDMEELYDLQFRLSWNSTLLNLIELSEGDFLTMEGETLLLNQTSQEEGYTYIGCTLLGDVPGVNGSGILVSMLFFATDAGEAIFDISETGYDEYDAIVTILITFESSTESKEHSVNTAEPRIQQSPQVWTVRGPAGPNNFPNLQAAINAPGVLNGDIIHVYAGVDNGPITVWKSLVIIGEGVALATINGGGSHAVIITANNVEIKEFTITNGNGGIVTLPAVNVVTISNNVVTNNRVGIALWRSGACTIIGNYPINNNICGVLLWGAQNAEVRANNITNSWLVGIQVLISTGNVLFNNFMGNLLHVWPPMGGAPGVAWNQNFWQPPAPACPADPAPLPVPWWWCPSDINFDGKVNIMDIATAAMAFGSSWSHIRWNPKADVNGDGRVDIIDIAAMAKLFGWRHP